MSGLKRLTPQQSRKANALIKKTCCNCMGGNCILLDDGDECVCPQLISYSLLCRWFQNAVLPADKLLYAELYQAEDRRRCAMTSPSENERLTPTPQSELAACGQRRAEYIMILPYSHSPSVQSVAGNGYGCMRTMQG